MNSLEKALLTQFNNKSNYKKDTSFKRWLDDGEIIELKPETYIGDNVEFSINGNDRFLIWLSQLNETFIDLKNLELTSGKLINKLGAVAFIQFIKPIDFIDYIKGKKFKVKVNSKVAKFNVDKLQGLSALEAKELIQSLVREKKFTEAANYLIGACEYSLIEL